MLVGARLSRVWSHHRAHRFFSAARWSVPELSAVLTRLVVDRLVPAGEPVLVAIDDTLFHRRGPKVHAASWFHDGSAPGGRKVGYGNNWVIAAIVVRLAFLDRPLALPVGFALVRKGTDSASRLALARRLVERLATTVAGRAVQVVADSAYAGKALRDLPATITPDHPATQQRRPLRPGPTADRQTWAASAQGRQAGPTGRPGHHRHLHHDHRAPLRDHRHRAGRGPVLPVVRRVRPATGAGRPGPRPRHQPTGPA
ncbi:MAG: transposase [Actinomycetales bacterium]|nr:transposase [Actinomycetales bacterium]